MQERWRRRKLEGKEKAAWGRVEERERQSGKQSGEEWNCFQSMETLLSCEWMCRWMEKRLRSEHCRKRWEHVIERNMRDSSKFAADSGVTRVSSPSASKVEWFYHLL